MHGQKNIKILAAKSLIYSDHSDFSKDPRICQTYFFFNLITFEKKTCPITLVALTAHHTPN